jgi:hypothetical protein
MENVMKRPVQDEVDGVHGEEMGYSRVDETDGVHSPPLPPEIWTAVIQRTLRQDPSSRYILMYVCKMFLNILRTFPLPCIYISPEIMMNVRRLISVRRLMRVSGRNSGLVLEIRGLLRNTRWANAWLHLRERGNRWFDVTYIWWRTWRYRIDRAPR